MAKKSSFWSDFQAFIMRGNVINLAVAVVIGGAFGQIINSLVADIITPAILQPALSAANLDALGELSFNGIKYGLFLAAVINFLVIAFAIFLVIRAIEKMQRRFNRAKAMEELDAPPPAPDPAVVAQENLTAAIERLANLMENRQQ